MAKMLRHEPPSSFVARLLDPVAANRAVQKVAVYHGDPTAFTTDPTPAEPNDLAAARTRGPVKREIVLTRETDTALDQLLALFRRSTGARLSTSHVVRVILLVAYLAMDRLESELASIGPLDLPSNARNREAERKQFESMLAQTLAGAVRDAMSDR